MLTLDTLPPSMAIGMLLYPNMMTVKNEVAPADVSTCVVVDQMAAIDLLGGASSAQRSVLASLLDAAVVEGGTPTHDAYTYGLDHLIAFETALPKYMLLITDGQPTFLQGCYGTGYTAWPVDEQPIIDTIAMAKANAGISTFLIGAPGSEVAYESGEDNRPWLPMAAEQGGTARQGCSHSGAGGYCHFDLVAEPDFATGLQRALAEIAASIVQCEYALPPPPTGDQEINTDQVNVIFTDGAGAQVAFLRNDNPDCQIGWQYSADRTRITLCEGSCLKVKSEPEGELELLYGCSTLKVTS